MSDNRTTPHRYGDPAPLQVSTLRWGSTVALTLALGLLWSLLHHYRGLSGDAELYAVQALAHIHPALFSDIYLQHENQDHFTIFSPLYAGCIRWLGLQPAALTLAAVFTVWTFLAAWYLARQLVDRQAAWLAVAFVMIAESAYGAYGVFSYLEDWLTARSLGVALVISALACHFYGSKRLALLIALGACCVHPLIALPGVLVLVCLWIPPRMAVIGAVGGIVGVLILAASMQALRLATGPFELIDGEWLHVVRERSQFLFLQLWRWSDWETNIRPFLCLSLTALAVPDPKVRRLCFAGMLVGASGLAVALIAGLVGPVAILLQGQAWRWDWITCFFSILLVLPTAMTLWKEPACGPLCALLLVLGWTFAPVDGLLCIGAAIILWSARDRIDERSARLLRWGAALLGLIIILWLVSNAWTIVSAPLTAADPSHLGVSRFRSFMEMNVSAVLFIWLVVWLLHHSRSVVIVGLLAIAMALALVAIMPGSLLLKDRDGSAAEIREYADWRNVIPPSATVYVAGRQAKGFSWFTLERPSYLNEDQSAGVVFSRATAEEIVRRSEVLLPLEEQSWRVLDRRSASSSAAGAHRLDHPLTAQVLSRICGDPVLDFVVAKPAIDVPHLTHTTPGAHFRWNLYDCRALREGRPPA